METFDVAVVGAGPGGYPAAIRAAQLGASVALIEREELGGACLNWGCIPSKTLTSAAQLMADLESAKRVGIEIEARLVDYPKLLEYKNNTVKQLRKGVDQLLAANGVNVVRGSASFENRNDLAVKTKEGSLIDSIGAEKVIIAAGASSQTSSGFPKHNKILNSRSFLDLQELPTSVLIVGGGVIGCEFACLLAQFGVRVVLAECSNDVLTNLDDDIRREVRRHLEKWLGIRILTKTTIEDVAVDTEGVRVQLGEELLRAELMIDATRRKPAVGTLQLERALLKADSGGYIPVDEYGQTHVASIYAIGDITGGPQLAHAATSQGLTVAENTCRRSPHQIDRSVPCCIFTNPEIGTVGLTEAEAARQGRDVKTGRFRFGASGRALTLGRNSGFAKWVADPGTNQLLGAAVVGPMATELIAEATLALKAELTADELVHTVHAHPTLSEIWFESAGTLLGQPLHSAPRRG